MVKHDLGQKYGDEQANLVFTQWNGGLQLILSRMKEQIIEHVAYKYFLERKKWLLLEISLKTRHKKLTSFSLSDKDTNSGILGNATNREYLDYFKAPDKLNTL